MMEEEVSTDEIFHHAIAGLHQKIQTLPLNDSYSTNYVFLNRVLQSVQEKRGNPEFRAAIDFAYLENNRIDDHLDRAVQSAMDVCLKREIGDNGFSSKRRRQAGRRKTRRRQRRRLQRKKHNTKKN